MAFIVYSLHACFSYMISRFKQDGDKQAYLIHPGETVDSLDQARSVN
jgi:hypothetical protein